MNLQPTLEDDLIRLRPLVISDYEPLYEVAKDPLIWEQHPCHDRYKKEVFSAFFDDSVRSGGCLIAIDKANGNIIGSSRFKPVEHAGHAVEIGWSFLSRHYWGGVYNKAMKKLMIDHTFKSLDIVVFYIGKENFRSRKAVEKIGGCIVEDDPFRHLVKKSEADLTYMIFKHDWHQ
ncbi:MAG: GNAT family N-acetyltransferase [Lewinellaceae bacterium]|nr:GNAT family N-acetyltransferase [Saprospiraceae bacterium]MCB9307578.1 GNAT family N-acetyltransferase [Lewinellaceae bacterium]MCB9354554.1 GNAT family N-acetyltransferase [Lewinellaceae bacterium]